MSLRRRCVYPCLVLSLILIAGCQGAGQRFLSLFAPQPVLGIALVAERPVSAAALISALNPLPPYEAMQKAISAEMGRPVATDMCFPFQAESGLDSGWYHIAVLSPAQLAQFGNREREILAVRVESDGRAARPAVLVVAAGSPLVRVEELRQKVVAFGPPDDARTHYAALDLLAQAGLKPADLSLELLPVPGSLKHMPDGRAAAQSVINNSSAAGFIDEQTWNEFPAADPREGEPARDKLRVIARTADLPSRVIVRSPKLDDAAAGKLRDVLLALAGTHPEALSPLNVRGFIDPPPEIVEACRQLARAGVSPTSQPAK